MVIVCYTMTKTNSCGVAAAESYPRCGADACSSTQPAAYEGSDKFGNLTFTIQLSANSGLLPFGQAQSWAVGNATLALLLPVIGKTYTSLSMPMRSVALNLHEHHSL